MTTWRHELVQVLGGDRVMIDPADTMVYEYDFGIDRGAPDAVVVVHDRDDVVKVFDFARERGLAVVARGAGTGIAGGAVPWRGGIVVSIKRLNHLLEVDVANRAAWVEPGVLNLELSQELAAHGYFYAPDPSSQRASCIGGNIGYNAGGPHCLAYGVTANHVLGLELVLPNGNVIETGGLAPDRPGYDLTGVVCGSEGGFGIVTRALVRIVRLPEDVRTLLAIYPSVGLASRAVSAIIRQGIVPTAMEMMDQLTLQVVQQMTDCGYPSDAGAVLLIEIEGPTDTVAEQGDLVAEICAEFGASEVKTAADARARAALWLGRKSAAGAFGRVKPNFYLHDTVVPRTKLPEVLRSTVEIAAKYDLPIANVFHAGDGNLHPAILFDIREPGVLDRVLAAGEEILAASLAVGGTLSGEHGIGLEKRDYMSQLFTESDLDAMRRLKAAFDPDELCNPGKKIPPKDGSRVRPAPVGVARV